MACLLKSIVVTYKWTQTELADPRTKNWPLMQSPIPVVFIGVIYLLSVFEWLPKFMENRKPYNLRKLLMAYNLLQVILSAYIIIQAGSGVLKMNVMCAIVNYSPHDEDAMIFAKMSWLYFIIKIFDMADTVFFILRKKFNQVTFLHVYHHYGMVVSSWIGVKYVAGGEAMYLGLINCVVHVIMYSYYFYAIWRPDDRAFLMRLKKLVTQLQLIQFAVLECNYVIKFITGCAFPKLPLVFLCIQNLLMICMFGEFYYRAYIKVKPTK